MITTITQDLLISKINRPRTKCACRKAVVIHWTANTNKGANAKANRNYFNNTTNYAGTQYVVDDKFILQCIPDDEVGWAVGATSYTAKGKSLYYKGLPPNYTTVNIEMCVNADADYNLVEQNTAWLVAHLLIKYKLTLNDVLMHHDITGKNCHAYYVADKNAWNNFKAKVKDIYNDIMSGGKESILESVSKQIKLIDMMNLRKGPAQSYNVITSLPKGTVLSVYETVNGWYKVKYNGVVGYMSSNNKYSKDVAYDVMDDKNTQNSPSLNINGASGKIIADVLNVRQEPSTTAKIVSTYRRGEVVSLLEEKAGWYRTNKGWIYAQYVERVDERFNATLINNANIRDVNLNIITTGQTGDKILTSTKKQVINGITVYACKYKDVRGYIQAESFKRL